MTMSSNVFHATKQALGANQPTSYHCIPRHQNFVHFFFFLSNYKHTNHTRDDQFSLTIIKKIIKHIHNLWNFSREEKPRANQHLTKDLKEHFKEKKEKKKRKLVFGRSELLKSYNEQLTLPASRV